MKSPFSILFACLIVIVSCNENKQPPTVDGVWQQLGYGKIFQIENDSVKIYDINRVACGLIEHNSLQSEGVVKSFSTDSLVIQKNIKSYRFERLDKLPETCIESKMDPKDPVHNFEVLWNTFDENYCYFEDRNIDWDEKYNTYKSKISSETTDLELFLLFDEMLSSMNDSHVKLFEPQSLEDTLQVLNQNKKSLKKIKAKISNFQLADKIAAQYCEDCKTHNAGIAKWGLMKNNIGYVQINAMWLMAYYDIPQDLPLREFVEEHYGPMMDRRVFQRQDEIDGARKLSKIIFENLKDANAIVIDFRFNGGGKDEVGLEILGHLVNTKTKIASKKARLKAGYTNHQDIYIEERLPFYNKEVYVLTSHLTASASDLAVMSTLTLDKVTRIGSNTEGIFSDSLEKLLPNGWYFNMSNEVYTDTKGINYESIGIAPNIELNYSKDKGEFLNMLLDQLENGGDIAIEKVFELEGVK